MSEDNNSMLQQATDSINSGNFNEALEQARGILVSDPTNGDAKLIEAISLSQLKNSRDASEAFAESIRLMPTSVKARFNAAVHEFNYGNVGEARILAKEASSLDPSHEGTKTLIQQMGPEQPIGQPDVSYPRMGSAAMEVPNEGIAFIRENPGRWTAIGWAICALTFCFFVFFWATIFPHFNEFMEAAKSGNQDASRNVAMKISNPVLSFGPYIIILLNIVWMIMDIIHRKGSFLWLIAHIPCSCCGTILGGNFITLPLYMLFGRK
jgi:tetratricopeptide (TPR) repeat protein